METVLGIFKLLDYRRDSWAKPLQERDDFTNFTNIEGGFLAPMQRLQIVDESNQPIRLLDFVRENDR
ncbi:MAG: hypothetical protein ACSHYA_18830 [Opitutaceae bacterium]